MFKDRYHPAVKKDLRKIDKAVREEIKKVWIPKLLSEPNEGKELTGPLSGIRSYHFKAGNGPLIINVGTAVTGDIYESTINSNY